MDTILNPIFDMALMLLIFSFILALARRDDAGAVFFVGGSILVAIWLLS